MSNKPTRFHYALYGLTLDSDFELRGLPNGDTRPEAGRRVRIRRAEIDEPSFVDRDPWIFVNAGSQQFLAWAAVGAFRVTDGLIEVDANPGVPDSLVSLPLLGAVMATLLHRRGLRVFHASAVSVDARGIALLGDKGAGKSTTAGALVAAGHRLISDDIVALDYERQDAPMLLPANAELKLWPDSGERLRAAGLRQLGRIHADIDKAHYAPASPVAESVELQRLYLLERRDEPGVRMLPAAEALSQLLRHTYMARFGTRGFGSHLPTYFQHAAHLIRDGKVRVLGVPRGLDCLGELPSLVEADLETTSPPSENIDRSTR
jgi:hypothetical protein